MYTKRTHGSGSGYQTTQYGLFTRPGRTATCIGASLLAISAAQAQLVQSGQSAPSLRVQMLPDGARGSEATCAVRVPDSPTVLVGGQIVDAADYTIWRAAYWAAGGDAVSGPHMLPDLGHGSAVFKNCTGPAGLVPIRCFAGTVLDDNARTQPAAWVGVGAEANLFVLPTPENAGGEAHGVAVGDFNNDGVPDIAVCGFVTDGTSNTIAAVWVRAGDGNDTFALHQLPSLAPGAECAALAISHTYDADLHSSVQASGYSYDAQGRLVAAYWKIELEDVLISSLTDLPDGYDSLARTETVSHDESITVGGAVRNPQGVERPALFIVDYRDEDDVTTRLLPLPTGANGGRVNSIIAILIGLLAGGEVDTPQGNSAAIWINQPEIPGSFRALDLNRLESNRPQGTRLRSVNAILPYIEQDNIYRLVGTASDAQGRRHGYIGVVGSDHAWGAVKR